MSAEKVRVTAEMRRYLLDPRLCGLFESGVVRKHSALATHLYTVNPGINPRLQRIIRDRIMPTLRTWTHGLWRETGTPQQSTLNWVANIPAPDFGSEWEWDQEELGGLAYPGGDVMLRNRNWTVGRELPEEIVYSNGLHEAAHALFFAVHSEQGLMCIQRSCFRENLEEQDSVTTWNWPWRGPVSRNDHATFALYGLPMFRDGMTIAEVDEHLEIVETRRNSRLGTTIFLIVALFALALAVAAWIWASGAFPGAES